MEKSKKIAFLIIAFCSFIAFSCKTTRTVLSSVFEKNNNMRPVKLVEHVLENDIQYENLSYKFSAEVTYPSGNSDSFTGNVRIKHDSIVWISFRALNIEGLRLCITQDSIKAIQRLQSKYVAEHISQIEKLLGTEVSFEVIEALLSDKFFFYTNPEDTMKFASDYKNCNDSLYYCISSISEKRYNKYIDRMDKNEKKDRNISKREFGMVQTIQFIPEKYKVKSMYLETLDVYQFLFVDYDRFMKYEKIEFPSKMLVEIENSKINISVDIEIENVDVNVSDMTYPFKISQKYTKYDFNESNQ